LWTASQSWPIFQCAHKCENFFKNANFKTDLMTSYMNDPYVFVFIWEVHSFLIKWRWILFLHLLTFIQAMFKKSTKIRLFFDFDGIELKLDWFGLDPTNTGVFVNQFSNEITPVFMHLPKHTFSRKTKAASQFTSVRRIRAQCNYIHTRF